jgi:glycosyltransferase involved in cell wall biosynthesis
VVDNASTDTTASVALSFQGSLNLKFIREERIGIPYARNAGLRTASGDVLAFIDDDCEAEPEWLAELEKPFLEDPHVGSVGGSVLPLEGLTGVVARFYGSRQTSDGEGSAAR